MDDSFTASLKRALAQRPPQEPPSGESKPAGVLVLVYRREGSWRLLLNRRSELVGQHKGEIAFPGGAREPEDADMLACALREGREEMGIRPEDVEVLGQLDPLLTRTRYLVYPFVGRIPYPYEFTVDEREVAEVLEVPLGELLDPSAVRHEAHLAPDGGLLRRFSYAAGAHLVYGATAVILTQFLGLAQTALASKQTARAAP